MLENNTSELSGGVISLRVFNCFARLLDLLKLYVNNLYTYNIPNNLKSKNILCAIDKT